MKAAIIVISVNLSTHFVVSHILGTKVSPECMEVKPGIRDPEKVSLSPEQRRSFNRGNRLKDYGIFVLCEILCPLNGQRCPKGEVPLYNILFISSVKNQYL